MSHRHEEQNEATLAPTEDGPAGATGVAAAVEATAGIGLGDQSVLLQGRYRILGLLGAGGMGSVYRARDEELGEVVALKMLKRELADRADVLERFRREVTLARRVTHKNVARVFDIGQHGGERFLTMEYIDGESLARRAAGKAMAVAEALDFASHICAALEVAHEAGVVHRDLKPDNVMLARDGRVIVADFGIARALTGGSDSADGSGEQASHTVAGGMMGTPTYMAPEQVEGKPVDGRTDLYALGALLFELVTGKRPFTGDSAIAVAVARLTQPPPDPRQARPGVPDAVATLITTLMAKSPADRPASAAAAHAAIHAARASLTHGAAVHTLSRAIHTSGHAIGHATSTILPATPAPPSPAVPTPRASEKTLAVLPFKNAGAAEDDYVAGEITDELIDGLSMSGALRVRPRSALKRFTDDSLDPRDVGSELGVQVVVSGSVRRHGDKLRVTARAISVADGFQLWAKRFEQPVAEFLEVTDQIASAIAAALNEEGKSPAREAHKSAAAMELFLQGRREYRGFYPPALLRAVACCEQALALAPGDGEILAVEGMALARLGHLGVVPFERARQVAALAVAAAPQHAEAHLAMAMSLRDERAADAMRALRPALALAPGLPEVQLLCGSLLAEAGADEGLRWLAAAHASDPYLPFGLEMLTRIHGQRGERERANAYFDANLASPERPIGPSLWRHPVWFKDRVRADACNARLAGYSDSFTLMIRGALQWLDGKSASPAREGIAGTFKTFRDPLVCELIADVDLMEGKLDDALATVEQADALGLSDVTWIDGCPTLAPLRDLPRFQAVRAHVQQRAAAVIAAFRA